MNHLQIEDKKIQYNDDIVKKFALITIVWAIVAMLAGVYIALELAFWQTNLNHPWLTFGRLRPLHTNAAIFAFAGNAIFAGIYYSTQRLCRTRIFSDFLSNVHFWGWQLVIVSAAITLPLGITQGKEYAELEWPIDILITAVWVVFAVNFFGTLARRRVQHMYVALWFYIATIITVAMLHIVNSLAIPFSATKSYPVFSGIADALVQWWYGHNAVAFFLTTPFLGLMYYFVPKAIGGPIYSYRLSIVHFWSLVFLYIWAGPHHLLYTALPEWAQTLGMVFSVMLWAPSWGGMINGLLTLRGAWHRIRTEPIIQFFVAGLTFYGMATFEGPLLSIKSVSSLAHYTDWIIGHVHSGALGWNGFMTFGMLYYLVPKLWKTELYSWRLAKVHFWLGLSGIVLYVASMWAAGITQGLMWRALDESGKLVYPDFVETVIKIVPLYVVRVFAGVTYLSGVILMLYNILMTVRRAKAPVSEKIPQDSTIPPATVAESLELLLRKPHSWLEGVPTIFTVLTLIAVSVGGMIQIVPMLTATRQEERNISQLAAAKFKPYRPLEVAGRDIYVREGCYTCHSQMVRPLVSEALRYGPPSIAEESMFDRPFQWGSRRIGPDLARVGGKYPDVWHYRHMINPRELVHGSIMPAYPWLETSKLNLSLMSKKVRVMKELGVPYFDNDVDGAADDARAQAKEIGARLKEQGAPEGLEDKEIVALIAYLQRLGVDYRKTQQGGMK